MPRLARKNFENPLEHDVLAGFLFPGTAKNVAYPGELVVVHCVFLVLLCVGVVVSFRCVGVLG